VRFASGMRGWEAVGCKLIPPGITKEFQ